MHALVRLALACALVPLVTAPAAARSRHADVWTFGVGCRMSWNADASSFSFTSNAAISTSEGCASFSDPTTGALLIYSDGITVWNASGGVISGAGGLGGHSSSMHSAVIVPVPGEPGKVYVFGHTANSSSDVKYQKYDTTSGTAVASGGISTITLGTNLAREGMLVMQHRNGIDRWLLISGGDRVFVIPVTTGGVGAPTSVLSGITVWPSGWHVFTASHQNDKLVMSANSGGPIVSWSFDNATGALSDRTVLSPGFSRYQYYGGVFSPDGTKLYFSTLDESNASSGPSRLYQYDYDTDQVTQISSSSTRYSHGDGRLAPDGRIYVAGDTVNAIHVIDDPDAAGAACGFHFASVHPPSGCTVNLGLPQTPSPLNAIALDLTLTVASPGAQVTSTSVTPRGTANAPDGAAVSVAVSGPDGYAASCEATVVAATWTCADGAIAGLDYGVYALDATVTYNGDTATTAAPFERVPCAEADAPEVCSDLVDNDDNRYVDGYDLCCQAGALTCTVPVTPAAFTIELARSTGNHFEDLFWPVTGDVDHDGETEILAHDGSAGTIDVLDGATLAIESQIPVNGDRGDNFTLANLDDDPELEVITMVHNVEKMLVADFVDGAWVVNSSSETAYSCQGNVGTGLGIGVADFDGDGKPEIYYGNSVWTTPDDLTTGCSDCVVKRLDANRDALSTAKHGCYINGGGNPEGAIASVADVLSVADCGGAAECAGPELIVAGQVWSVDVVGGHMTLRRDVDTFGGGAFGDGFNAVADLDNDGDLDVVVHGPAPGGNLYAYDPRNSELLRVWSLPGGPGHGYSPLTIADVYDEDLADDGDTTNGSAVNVPEIVLTRVDLLHAVNLTTSGTVWSLGTTDNSGSTSTTVFDFNGDGVLELAYRDTSQMRVMYGGPLAYAPAGVDTATRNYAAFACSSPTMNEGPTVADVDDDGAAELVVVCGSNQSAALKVFRSASTPWREARHVWNQGMFSPGAIDERGEVYPVAQARTSFIPDGTAARPLNVAIAQISPLDLRPHGGEEIAAIDARVSSVYATSTVACGNSTNAMDVAFTVENRGDAVIPGDLKVAVYPGDPATTTGVVFTLGEAAVLSGGLPLAGGESARFKMRVPTGAALSLWVVLNDDGAGGDAVPHGDVAECDPAGNVASDVACHDCTDEVCDGYDNDCDGAIDEPEDLVLAPCSNQQGVCAGAMTTVDLCVDGAWVDCTDAHFADHDPRYDGDVAADLCDGLDTNCDGLTDNGHVATETSCGQGVCAATGLLACVGGAVVDTCAPDMSDFADDVCDGLDNDCDGLTDAADPGLVRVLCDEQRGACAGTTRPLARCLGADGWDACTPADYAAQAAGYATTDACDGVDNDCDGGTDEDHVTTATSCGLGVCAGGGQLTCQAGQVVDSCAPDPSQAGAETCNGADDDCDGLTDAADPSLQIPLCDEQDGVCAGARPPASYCQAGGWLACDAAVFGGHAPGDYNPGLELCDGLDNDCDGGTDEGLGLGFPCVAGSGLCAVSGQVVCWPDKVARCSVEAGEPAPEICDGLDNDCNGVADDNATGGSVCAEVDTEILTHPQAVEATGAADFTFRDPLNPGATGFECQLDGGAWTACDGGAAHYEGLAAGSHTFLVRAVGDGTVDGTPAFYTWAVDPSSPDTAILAGPDEASQATTAVFAFRCTVTDPAAWWCALDAGVAPAQSAYAPCSSAEVYADLAEGDHTLAVYCVNQAGTPDPTPASWSWTIDTSAPDTLITGEPDAATAETSATFTYEDPNDAAADTFLCRLDGGPWFACDGGTVTLGEGEDALADGLHLFQVATVDASGNADPSPATSLWLVDTSVPDTTIDTGPADPSQSGDATFVFSCTDPDGTFFCGLDAGAASELAACDETASWTGLTDGEHRLRVYCVNAAGTADPEPAEHVWLIDTTFPETEILSHPASLVSPSDPNAFTYADPTDEAVTTFECSLDGAPYVACDGGAIEAGPLPAGSHTFHVRACDGDQCDPTPAVYAWEVTTSPCPLDGAAPTLSCAAPATLECVDGGATTNLAELAPTASDSCLPVSVTSEEDGTFGLGTTAVVFTARDGNGNIGSCVTEVTVSDTAAPSVACPDDVTVSTPEDACAVTVALDAPTADDACWGADGLTVFDDAPPVFGVGETVVTMTALDPAGHQASCEVSVTVVDDVPLSIACDETVEREAPADVCGWSGTLEATATDNCAVDATLVGETSAWPVGVHSVRFDASDDAGNAASCTSALTVVDVTPPTVACGEPVGTLPVAVRAQASDACAVTASIEAVDCSVGGVAMAPADCPIEVDGDTIRVVERRAGGVLEVTWTAQAEDASGLTATAPCTLTLGADMDQDGVVDEEDNCPGRPNTDQIDSDGDGVGDACDVCPVVKDPEQLDGDDNGVGDACQDTDGDTVLDTADNCPLIANTDQLDFDEDGLGNACDDDDQTIQANGGGGCAGGGPSGSLALLLGLLVLLVGRATRRVRGADPR